MDELVFWVENENRSYSDGVKLYEQFGTNRNLLRFYSLGENVRSRESIFYELNEVRKKLGLKLGSSKVKLVKISADMKVKFSADEEIIPLPENNVSEIATKGPISLDEPAELEELTKRHAYLFRQKEILRLSLYNFPKHNEVEVVMERKMVMEQILKYKEDIAEIALKRKFYEKNGFFPEEYKDTKEQLLKKRGNARSNISRQKSIIKNAKSVEDKLKAEKRLARYEQELKEIEMKISAK